LSAAIEFIAQYKEKLGNLEEIDYGDVMAAGLVGSATAFLCSQKFLIGSVVRSTGTIGKKDGFFPGNGFEK
jgi:hypothetical protein